MLVNLANIEENQILTRHVDVVKMEVEAGSEVLAIHDLKADFKFRLDLQGYLMNFAVSTQAEVACSLCGQWLKMDLNFSDHVVLRKKHPADHHLVLGDAEMAEYFLENLEVDLIRVLEEIIELELPAYPRHKKGDSKCRIPKLADESMREQSPFGSLAKLIDD